MHKLINVIEQYLALCTAQAHLKLSAPPCKQHYLEGQRTTRFMRCMHLCSFSIALQHSSRGHGILWNSTYCLGYSIALFMLPQDFARAVNEGHTMGLQRGLQKPSMPRCKVASTSLKSLNLGVLDLDWQFVALGGL